MSRRYPAWKSAALREAQEVVIDIEDAGHEVLRCTDHHWKIDGIDVWPSSKKYMKHGLVKEYEHLQEIFK